MTRRAQGFTLVELLVVLGLASMLALLTWPALSGQLRKARRADATAALQQLQMAQERHLALHGLYAPDLSVLGTSAQSPGGMYRIELRPTGADAYLASARARADGPQSGDGDCADITLRVDLGFAQPGPSACWAR